MNQATTKAQFSPLNPPLPETPGAPMRWGQLYGSARALAIAQAARAHDGVTVVICPGGRHLDGLILALEAFGSGRDRGNELRVFPDWETLPYDLFSPHPDIVSQRLSTLHALPRMKTGTVVVPVPALLQRLVPRDYVESRSLSVAVADRFEIDGKRQELERAGYHAVRQVMDPGEFAVRGGLLDLFPMGTQSPYRIELFDDEVESIRSFDPETQLSLERHEAVHLLPAREFPMDQDAIRRFRSEFRRRFDVDPRRSPLYQDVSQGLAPGGLEYYLPLFLESTATLFDYLPPTALVVLDAGTDTAMDQYEQQAAERFEERRHDVERPLLPPEELFISAESARSSLSNYLTIQTQVFEIADNNGVNLGTAAAPEVPLLPRAQAPAERLHSFLAGFDGRTLFVADTPGRREELRHTLKDQGISPTPVDDWTAFLEGESPLAITVAALDEGLRLSPSPSTRPLAVITENQLLGERIHRRRRRRRARDAEAIVRNLTDLEIGAPVVHEDHGVGRFQGLTRLSVGQIEQEFVTLEYANGDRLYVPVASLQLISRYSGASPDNAPLHSLGGDQWQRIRKRAAQRAHDVAVELLDVHARRAARKGHAFVADVQLYNDFSAAFPYEETPDQRDAIESVFEDLTAEMPMDRVVCGDVGFGKTEVAMRAAFVAVQGDKQVAVLVPTTLLAQQHLHNFRDRFADWAIRVEVLSRFATPKQIKTVLAGLENGSVDVVIGTHRLLQGDVKFKDLGLLIVDEEHRFGVRHKERIKALRAQVDILTLTATPIPRTLNMSLSGLRDLSIIATAPPHRFAVKTFVTQWSDSLLREALQRELRRGGQVFFLHNEVETIDRAAARVRRLVPEARVEVAHGQMPERQLEQVMADFYRQRFNVLVCSTIIESGIHIPTANTIIINRADRLGLAQLHQLRGRVGRSHHRAYAYLIVPPPEAMTADAIKRLEAIESLEELGAGFTLATHDLEIRGAGELLGEEQSGQIQEVGFALYAELLERAVRALRDGKQPDLDRPLDHGTEVDLHVATLIPADYLPDVHERLILYKRVAGAESNEDLRELQVEMIDRFGLLPDTVKNLFEVARLKLRAGRLGVKRLEMGDKGGRLIFGEKPDIDPTRIVQLVQEQPRRYILDGQDKLRITMELPDLQSRVEASEQLLTQLGAP